MRFAPPVIAITGWNDGRTNTVRKRGFDGDARLGRRRQGEERPVRTIGCKGGRHAAPDPGAARPGATVSWLEARRLELAKAYRPARPCLPEVGDP